MTGVSNLRHDGAHKGPGIARIEWLDGVRALAAIYVMLHHIYLHVFPGFPESPGPFGLGWLMYGQLAVVVFIVVSGFSLGLAPARGGNRLKDGASGFFQRRAWRILPPYWVALLFSLAVAHFLLVEAPGREVNVRSLVVHGLLLHDIIRSNSPNSAFWSIAVEAQIYLFFPLMLMLTRARSPVVTALPVLAIVLVAHLLAQNVAVLSRLDHLSLQLYACFAFGVWAVEETSSSSPHSQTAACLDRGRHRGWADRACPRLRLSVGGRPLFLDRHRRRLRSGAVFRRARGKAVDRRAGSQLRPARFFGRFSYSLDLVHGPIVMFLTVSPPVANPFLRYASVRRICHCSGRDWLRLCFLPASNARSLPYDPGPP